MVHIRVDLDRCNGHGLCQTVSPGVYEVNPDTSFNEAGEFDVPDGLRLAARSGANACPEGAIALDEEPGV
ncbi:ferredoxin [Streptomyces sp. NPDC006617]|uniref:ferredoxin n=1 Tax=Streptomyces sp. NPDC006617 TaxID=3155354 RepID=UPI0033AEA897